MRAKGRVALTDSSSEAASSGNRSGRIEGGAGLDWAGIRVRVVLITLLVTRPSWFRPRMVVLTLTEVSGGTLLKVMSFFFDALGMGEEVMWQLWAHTVTIPDGR